MISARIPRSALLGTSLIAILVAAVALIIARHSSAAAAVKVQPLTVDERRALDAGKPLVMALPRAFAEVPIAASDATDGRASTAAATRILARTPALATLSQAVADPERITAALTNAYRDVRAGRTPASARQIQSAFTALQAVEAEIDPAIQLVAARSHDSSSTKSQSDVIDRDPRVRQLVEVVGGWSRLYGVLVLVAQESANGN
jgi:hypothetical protein